jgi:hypothetical protein
MQDGLVSTPGALTGIAVRTQSSAIVILSGLAIVKVESLSWRRAPTCPESRSGSISNAS